MICEKGGLASNLHNAVYNLLSLNNPKEVFSLYYIAIKYDRKNVNPMDERELVKSIIKLCKNLL